MPSVVYCDNKDCIYYDDFRGCDVDRLVIERGVCVGSKLHGRNVSENDLDERLKAENAELRYKVHVLEGGNKELKILYDSVRANNAKLRELIRTVWLAGDFRAFLGVEEIKERMRELGIEVPHECE